MKLLHEATIEEIQEELSRRTTAGVVIIQGSPNLRKEGINDFFWKHWGDLGQVGCTTSKVGLEMHKEFRRQHPEIP